MKRGPGRPKQPVSRETLIAHARAAFGEEGYAGASMDLIARRAGLRKSSLFHHFATKDELYLAVFADILGELGRSIDTARTSEGSFAERLDVLSRATTTYLGEHPEVAGILLRELIDRGPFFQGVGRSIVEGVLQSIVSFLEEMPKKDGAPDLDLRQLALTFAGVHLTYFAAWDSSFALLGRSPFAPDTIDARIAAVTVHARRLCGL